MLSGVNLKKIGQGWGFANEAALEDFVWTNLKSLFNLTPLKRQFFVRGEVCDILAVDDNRQLVVLELKNIEDRYIVQQLTLKACLSMFLKLHQLSHLNNLQSIYFLALSGKSSFFLPPSCQFHWVDDPMPRNPHNHQ